MREQNQPARQQQRLLRDESAYPQGQATGGIKPRTDALRPRSVAGLRKEK